MNENVKVIFGLIGGLALFLYGMNSMSDALQKAAGEKMKKILGFLVFALIAFEVLSDVGADLWKDSTSTGNQSGFY